MWPALAGGAYLIGGFAAARLAALACFTVSVGLMYDATRRLAGPAAGLGAAVVTLTAGSSLILAHYATYDLGAFPFVALAFWCQVRGARSQRSWRWALAAGLSLWLAALGKYAYAVMGLPLVLTIVALDDRNRVRDATLFTAAAAVPFFLSMRALFGQWIPPTLGNYDHATFAAPLVAVVVGAYVAIPSALWAWAYRERESATPGVRALLPVALVGLLMWPLLHALSGQIASAFKHAWLGALLAAPVAGWGLERAWRAGRRPVRAAIVTVLALAGAAEWVALEPMTYPNFRPSVRFLLESVEPEDGVYVVGDNDRWVYAMYLYGEGRVRSPFDVVDQDRGVLERSCDYEWVVATRTGVTGGLDDSTWMCDYRVAFEKRQRFLSYRGTFDTQTFRVYRRVEDRGAAER